MVTLWCGQVWCFFIFLLECLIVVFDKLSHMHLSVAASIMVAKEVFKGLALMWHARRPSIPVAWRHVCGTSVFACFVSFGNADRFRELVFHEETAGLRTVTFHFEPHKSINRTAIST